MKYGVLLLSGPIPDASDESKAFIKYLGNEAVMSKGVGILSFIEVDPCIGLFSIGPCEF